MNNQQAAPIHEQFTIDDLQTLATACGCALQRCYETGDDLNLRKYIDAARKVKLAISIKTRGAVENQK